MKTWDARDYDNRERAYIEVQRILEADKASLARIEAEERDREAAEDAVKQERAYQLRVALCIVGIVALIIILAVSIRSGR